MSGGMGLETASRGLTALEAASTTAVKALASAIREAAWAASESNENWTLGELAGMSADFLVDFHGGGISPSPRDLEPCILHSLVYNGYSDEDVTEMATASRFSFLDLADYAMQVADDRGIVVEVSKPHI